jgi:FMNH2-dependent dimethyl sulfone monooxygenase
MKFGLWTPLPHTIRAEPRMDQAIADFKSGAAPHSRDPAFLFALEVIQAAERFGFDTTLIAQRYLGPDLEAWTLTSALAAMTSSIELMIAVHPGIVTPQVVAKMGASLDRISGGRFAINLVNGWWQEEFQLFSNGNWKDDPDEKFVRMREYLTVIKGLWTDPDFDYQGQFYAADVRGALKGANARVVVPTAGEIIARPAGRQTTPPLYAASRSAPGKAIIAELCDVWFAEYKPGYRNFEQNLAHVTSEVRSMKEMASGFGRTLGFGLNPQVIVAPTMAEACAIADAVEDPANRDRISSTLGAGLVGTPEVVAERIRAYEDAGITVMMLRFSPMLDGLRTFGETVMPLLARP